MKSVFDRVFTVFNAIIPVAVIVFIVATHKDYVRQDEYNSVKNELFQRLDNVEALLSKLVKESKYTSNNTTTH